MRSVLDLLLPARCAGCDASCQNSPSSLWCASCFTRIPGALWPRGQVPEGLSSAWSLGSYEGPVGGAVRRGKYGRDPAALRALGVALAQAAQGRLPRVDAVVPVPQRLRSTLSRGFWPTAVLAQALASHTKLPLLYALKRRGGKPQAGLDAAARRLNTAGVFRAWRPLDLDAVLLVDDVLTTGATASACAQELLCAGVRRVHLIAACDA